jgi:uncharacterized membrane protein
MQTQQTVKFSVASTSFGLAGLAALLTLAAPSPASGGDNCARQYVLKTLDVPTTIPTTPGIGSAAFGINNRGQIVGNVPVAAPGTVTALGDGVVLDGFLFEEGAFVNVTVPGSLLTTLEEINDQGTATGQTFDNNFDLAPVGDFVRCPNGTIHSLSPVMPGAVFVASYVGINNQDTIVGTFTLNATLPYGVGVEGFILEEDVYTVFNYPGATGTFLDAINDGGTIAGTWYDAQGNSHGFLRQRDGTLFPVEVPGAGAGGTAPLGLNNRGDVVGFYIGTDSNSHGFVLSAGVFTTLDFPQDGGLTYATSINDEGVIVGTYGPGENHAFIATPVRDGR